MSVLKVGQGEEFATIGAAVAASHSGDTIAVDAGTYTAKDIAITHDLTLQAVGGAVNVVAPDLIQYGGNVSKGLFVVGNQSSMPNVTFDGFALSGAHNATDNAAGIRYQSGNLTLLNDTFQTNDDGLLATPYVHNTGTVIIQGSTFDHNGTSNGLAHNMYIGYIDTFVMRDSVSQNAIMGHEVKSRALNNTIVNNTIADGPDGTASYGIDLPNGGNAIIQGNTIEKGADADNKVMIHIGGGEIQHDGSVTVSGNTLINDYRSPTATVAVMNQGLAQVCITGNTLNGLSSQQLLSGVGTLSGNSGTTSAGKLVAATTDASTFYCSATRTIDLRGDTADHTLSVTKAYWTVEGGQGHATLSLSVPGVNVVGGSGGITVDALYGGGQIFTAAGSTNAVTLTRAGYVHSAGNDTITAQTMSSGKSHFSIQGTATVMGAKVGGMIFDVTGTATVHEQGGSAIYRVMNGGVLNVDGSAASQSFWEQDSTVNFHGVAVGTVSGGIAEFGSDMKRMTITTYEKDGGDDQAHITLQAGDYNLRLAGGGIVDAHADAGSINVISMGDRMSFIGGSGSTTVNAGSSAAHIVMGSGATTVSALGKAPVSSTYEVDAGISDGGTMTLKNYRAGIDQLVMGNGVSVVSQNYVGAKWGGGVMTIETSNNAHVIVNNFHGL